MGINFKVPRNGLLTALTGVIVALGGTAGYNYQYGGDAGVAKAQERLEERLAANERTVAEARVELNRRADAVAQIGNVSEMATRLDERVKSAEKAREADQMRNDASHNAILAELKEINRRLPR